MAKKLPDNVVPFRRKKRWTSAADYGVPEAGRPPRLKGWRRAFAWWDAHMTGWRPILLMLALITAWVVGRMALAV